jgi:predicted cupin superfamily sugar epimerase
VAPGFEFSAFQLAGESDLAPAIHRHGAWIGRLLR